MAPRTARFAELDTATLYALLRLRAEVFVVEQDCPYLDVDGRDAEAATRHCWIAAGDVAVASYLRITGEPDGADRIGRVVTAPAARGRGLAAELLRYALTLAPGEVTLDAQAHLQGYYAGFGFAPHGAPFVEDGIPHIPMRLAR